MQLPSKTWDQIGRLALVVISSSACFVVLSILMNFLMDKYFRGDSDALLIWLADFNLQLLSFAAICWLIVSVMVALAKLQERFLCRVKQVENSLEQSKELVK